ERLDDLRHGLLGDALVVELDLDDRHLSFLPRPTVWRCVPSDGRRGLRRSPRCAPSAPVLPAPRAASRSCARSASTRAPASAGARTARRGRAALLGDVLCALVRPEHEVEILVR